MTASSWTSCLPLTLIGPRADSGAGAAPGVPAVQPGPPAANLLALGPPALALPPPTNFFFGHGFVIHAFGFQFQDGSRTGRVLEDNNSLVDLQNALRLAHRAPTWETLWAGEYPVTITGFASRMNFLAYYMEITTNMRTFPPISGTEVPQRGDKFVFSAPINYYIRDIEWGPGYPTSFYLAPINAAGTAATTPIGWVRLEAYGTWTRA